MPYVYVDGPTQEPGSIKPKVKLTGIDGNVFTLLGECKKAMQDYQREVDPDYNANLMFQEMWDEVQQGDYDNALRIMMSYCEVS